MFDTHDMEEADYIAQCEAEAQAEAQYIAEAEAMAQAEEQRNDNTGQKSESPNTEEVEFDVEEILQPQQHNAKEVDEMIAKHESFKAKWLMLNDEDMFNRVALWEAMKDKITELKSLYYEEKQENDKQKWIRLIELKSMLNEQWKKVHTDSTADATIKQEFQQRDNEISVHKLQAELLQNKADAVLEYINIVKIHIKKDYSI